MHQIYHELHSTRPSITVKGMSDFLFATPTFLSGMARVFDIGGTFDEYNESPTPSYADSVAILNDFRAVGADLIDAAEQEADKTASQ